MAEPQIQLLWWPGCPSYDRTLADLQAVSRELDLDPDSIETIRIDTEDDATRESFPGSPTIRIDGRDVQPTDEPAGLTCRVYRLRDGRVSPTPDPADLRDALAIAIREEVSDA